MAIERLIKEQVYLIKRRYGRRTIKRNSSSGFDFKKMIGLVCVLLGLALLLAKCSNGGTPSATPSTGNSAGSGKQSNTAVSKTSKETKKEFVMTDQIKVRDAYYQYMQDFNIDEKMLAKLKTLALKTKKSYAETLAIWTIGNFKHLKQSQIVKCIKSKDSLNTLSHFGLCEDTKSVYNQFIYDLTCFPLSKKSSYTFENGWKEGRSYKGSRKHFGIDIMDPKNEPGKIKIYSMTDGIVENIGWNEVGGYRVGIRTSGGAYFYYAHLNQQPEHLQKGDNVYAGDYIGDMGNTGYGKENTRDKFPVHLHIGIAVKTKDNEEFWINPYYILKYLELKDFAYSSL